jgi:NAD(P)-dependent dehydrogenase (short-subunit alcohol dehydrogenase family)
MLPNGRKIALITGGAKRIGKALCQHLIHHGWNIILHCNHSIEIALDAAEREKAILGVEQCDFTIHSNIEKFANRVFNKYGKIELLINNASYFKNDTLDDFDVAKYQDTLSVNSLTPMLLIKYFAEQQSFDTRAPGRVINLLDDTLKPSGSLFTSYSISSILLEHITKLTAQHYAPDIMINAIALGTTLKTESQSHEHFQKMISQNMLGKAVNLDELMLIVEVLLQTTSMTGQVIKLSSERHS